MSGSSERLDLLQKLHANRTHLIEIVTTLNETALQEPRKAGNRSPKSQLLHLAEAEWIYVEHWAKRARDEDRPDLGGSSQQQSSPDTQGEEGQGLIYDEADALTLPVLLAHLDKIRQNTLEFIEETLDDQFQRQGRNSPFGDLSIIQFLKSLYRHDEMHCDEIQGKESQYIIKTTS